MNCLKLKSSDNLESLSTMLENSKNMCVKVFINSLCAFINSKKVNVCVFQIC